MLARGKRQFQEPGEDDAVVRRYDSGRCRVVERLAMQYPAQWIRARNAMQAAPAPKNCRSLKPPKDVLKVAGQPSRLAEPDDLQDEAEGREPQQHDGQEQRQAWAPPAGPA